MRLGRVHLRLGAAGRLALGDLIEGLKMALRRLELTLRLRQRYFRVVDQLLSERPFPLQRHPVLIKLLRSLDRLLRGLHIALRFGPIFGKSGARRGLIPGLRLLVLALGFVCGRRQIGAFELGEHLSGANMVAAIDEHAFHRGCDL